MSKAGRALVIGTGVVSILCGVYRIYLSLVDFSRAISGNYGLALQEYSVPYFYPAFYLMQTITIVFCLLLVYCGFDLVTLRLAHTKMFVRLFIFQLVYLPFVGGVLWNLPSVNASVAAASTATNGMFPSLILLLPLWTPFVILWARRKMRAKQKVG
jgi:hypothetical protein